MPSKFCIAREAATFLSLILFLIPVEIHASDDDFYNWLEIEISNDKKINTNQIVHVKQFREFISRKTDFDKQFYLGMTLKGVYENYQDHLFTVLGGPPDEVLFINTDIVLITACRFRSCGEKGMVWIDKRNRKVIFGVVAYFYNSDEYVRDGVSVLLSPDYRNIFEAPQIFSEVFSNWLSEHGIRPIEVHFFGTQTGGDY